MSDEVIGAFSEEQVERLTGVSVAQLRRWDRTNFFKPAFGITESGVQFGRVYSFKDLVSLRVLNQLRNVYGISMPELRRTAGVLRGLDRNVWTGKTLYVHRRKVVFEEPETLRKREVTSRQYVADIPLKVAISDTHAAIQALNKRDASERGHVVRARFVNHNAPVLSGTRIPVSAIKSFAEAGYSVKQILAEYPDLSAEDVSAALAFGKQGNAA